MLAYMYAAGIGRHHPFGSCAPAVQRPLGWHAEPRRLNGRSEQRGIRWPVVGGLGIGTEKNTPQPPNHLVVVGKHVFFFQFLLVVV